MFAELQKGGGVTSGLKKVDKSQMTHKNAALRATSKVSADAIKPKARAPFRLTICDSICSNFVSFIRESGGLCLHCVRWASSPICFDGPSCELSSKSECF
jgi:hypothetical protein